MKHIKTGFIKPNNERISLEYYEVENYCKEEIQKYIMGDEHLQKERLLQFQDFSKEYTYFNPYLDFVLYVMKYIQINPVFQEGYLGLADGDAYGVINTRNASYDELIRDEKAYYFNRSCDKNYNIQNGSIVENGMIDINGNVLELFSEGDTDTNAWGHLGLSCMVLNQWLISNKELCVDFEAYCQKIYANIYTMYLMGRLGFAQVTKRRSHRLIWINPDLMTRTQMTLAHYIKEYFGNEFLLANPKGSTDAKAKSLIKSIWRGTYENGRV